LAAGDPTLPQTMRDLTAKTREAEAGIGAARDAMAPIRAAKIKRFVRRPPMTASKAPLDESLRAVSSVSSHKLLGAAESVMRAGPSRLQFMADALGVSMATGCAPHRDRDEWLLGARPEEE